MKKIRGIIFIIIVICLVQNILNCRTINIKIENDFVGNNKTIAYMSYNENGSDTKNSEGVENKRELEENFDGIKNDVNNNLLDLVPENAKDTVNETLDGQNFLDAIKTLNIFTIIEAIKNEALKYIKDPLNIFVNTLMVILITAIFHTFKDNFLRGSLKQVVTYVSSIYIITFLALPMLEIINSVKDVILSSNTFMISFIPFFSSFLTASGKPVSAGVYSAMLFSLTQIISFCISNFLLPMLTLFFAFSLAGSINSSFNIVAITDGVKKIVVISLCVLITGFVSLLSFQSVVSSAGDNILAKTSKFMIGNFIPFVGGALSDAVTSVYGYMGLIKNGVGIFGVIVIILTFAPLLIQLSLTFIFTYISEIISDVLSIKEISVLLKAVNSTVTITIAIIMSVLVVTVMSFSLLLVIGGV